MTFGDNGDRAIDETLRLAGGEELRELASDPLTKQVLALMAKRPVSPAEVAAGLDMPIEDARQRLDELRRNGLIAVIETPGLGGTSEPFFQGPYSPLLDREEWEELDPEVKELHLSLITSVLNADIAQAIEAGTFDAQPDFHHCRIYFRMDQQGWDEMGEVYSQAFLRAMEIKERAEKRVRQGEDEGVRGTAALLLFEMPELE